MSQQPDNGRFAMDDRDLPSSRTAVHVNTSGAAIVEDELTLTAEYGARDSRDIYLPAHTEWISHIAVDIGGSLAKVVYFSRSPTTTVNGKGKGREVEQHHHQQQLPNGTAGNAWGSGGRTREASGGSNSGGGRSESSGSEGGHAGVLQHSSSHTLPYSPRSNGTPSLRTPTSSRPASPGRLTPAPNGVLGPESLASASALESYFTDKPDRSRSKTNGKSGSARHESCASADHHSSSVRPSFDRGGGSFPRRSTSVSGATIPGGWLNFTKFETSDMDSCIAFIDQLIESSSASHNIPTAVFKAKHVKLMATGGGAHLFYSDLAECLGVEVRKEEEMECLIDGLTFFMEIPNEVFWYSDDLVQAISHSVPASAASPSEEQRLKANEDLPRPSPNPPQYSLVFDQHPTPHFPCMLVNIGSGVSIIKVDDYGKYERISGTSLGGGTLWGLLSMLTGAESFDEMLALSENGDNSSVDMLVGDIYGSDYSKIGLKSSTIASTFGKVFRKGNKAKSFKPEDVAKSLLYAISNNIGQIAYMNAEKHNLHRIYFGGCFIRGHAATISTLSYAIRFWSKGTKKALFLRHEGYLGAIGAWLRNIEEEEMRR